MYGTVLAGLDEPSLVEAGDVLFHEIDLLGNHAQEGLQRIATLRVAEPVHNRDQLIQAIGILFEAAHIKLRCW
jgi:hypothetical protein